MKYEYATAGNNNDVIYKDCDGNSWTWSGGTRSWRNNNPGNIRDGKFTCRYGAIGAAGGFAIFPDYKTGFDCLITLLKTQSYQKLSLEQVINKYAPPIENDTNAYINSIEKQLNISRKTLLIEIKSVFLLAKAIEKHEGYKPGIIK